MANGVVMPKAGISVESCIIGQWKKKPGDTVKQGDILFDYETDKAAFECESTADGTLLEIFFEEGDEVPVLTVVCAVGAPGEDVSALRPSGAEAQASPPVPIGELDMSVYETADVISAFTYRKADGTVPAGVAQAGAQGVSPRARKLADTLKVDVGSAIPTGPRDRIIERDILAASEAMRTGTGIGGRNFDGAAKASAAEPVATQADYTDEKMSGIRRAIAKAMRSSLAETAQLTHHHSCDATAVLALRKTFKEKGEALGLSGVSINDMVMFVVVKTLLSHPDLNAHLLNGDTMRRFSGVHLGMAVDTPRGLIVPTIFNADRLTLKQLSDKSKELAALAKSGSISPDLTQGATFTVSNLGSLGVEMFTPIINPPQVAILGVCGTTTRVREGADGLEAYQSMGLSVTYDHRAVDGAPASRFARDLARNLESFDMLMAL